MACDLLFNNSLKIMRTLIYKIPPNLPFPEGGTIPLFGKEGVLVRARRDF